MLYYVCGELVYTDISTAVIDCGGVAYSMTVSGNTLGKISAGKNEKVRLYTHMQVKEDAIELYGFADTEELKAFRQLLTVSGVGPKAAMAILSLMTPEKFALAVTVGDTKAISRAQGVGAKTAARVVLELKDKVAKELKTAPEGTDFSGEEETGDGNKLSDAMNTLLVLGYTRSEAQTALRNIDTAALSLENIIKEALKKLMRN